MLRGDIGLLADLGIEVIKTQAIGHFRTVFVIHALRLRREGELPAALTDGL